MRENLVAVTLACVFVGLAWAFDTGHHYRKVPQYQYLPALKEQAKIYDGWREERRQRIPEILQKYGVDAWIVRPLIRLSL
jgi:hypothetical protein